MKSPHHTPQTPATSQSQARSPSSVATPHPRLLRLTATIDWQDSPPTPAAPASRSTLARTYPATTLFLAGLQSLFSPLLRTRLLSPASLHAPCLSTHADHSTAGSPAHPRREPRTPAPAGIPGSTPKSPPCHGSPVAAAPASPPELCKSSASLPSPESIRR